MKEIQLRNGVSVPLVGLGTWQIMDRALMNTLLAQAYDAGYRLIDTAAAYSNEIAVSKAMNAAGIARKEWILSDKVWNTSRGYEAVREACRRSLKKLKTDYLDLYLIHWPASPKLYEDWREINADTWRGMESLYEEGLVRGIGVCNFTAEHLKELEKTAKHMPLVNQREYHPGMPQQTTAAYCKEAGIRMIASSPLGNGQILKNSELERIAQDVNKSVAQVCLRWAIQRNVIVIPKTTHAQRLRENMDIFDFSLSPHQMSVIDSLPYCGGIGIEPDEVIEFG